MYMTIWIANETVPWMTELAKVTGSTDGSRMVAALDQGGNPLTYVFTQIFARENIGGAAVIAAIYTACLVFTIFTVKKERNNAGSAKAPAVNNDEGGKNNDETVLIGD